ncbi:MAG: DUF2695 domain-containing protein [Nocardioidaceae bacterium]
MSPDIIDAVESQLSALAYQLTSLHDRECVFCYVDRMLDAFGCDNTLRWAKYWRDHRALRATGLENRLARRGGYCDCEIFLNGWVPSSVAAVYDEETDDWRWREPRPTCDGVRRGSSQPCPLWQPLARPRY